jgi:hypothetical protein
MISNLKLLGRSKKLKVKVMLILEMIKKQPRKIERKSQLNLKISGQVGMVFKMKDERG